MIKTFKTQAATVQQSDNTVDSTSLNFEEEFYGQRVLDLFLSIFAITVLSPIILIRAVIGLITHGRLLAKKINSNGIMPARFAGNYLAANLASLFSVASGRYTFASENECNEKRCALFSAAKLSNRMGVGYLVQKQVAHATEKNSWGPKSYFSVIGRSVLASTFSPVKEMNAKEDLHLFGIRISNSTMTETVDWLQRQMNEKQQVTVGFVNADCLNKAYDDERYHHTLRQLDRIYPDGIGVRLASQMFGNGVADNINGTDLFPNLCERLKESEHSLFLLGAKPGVAQAVADKMTERNAGLQIAGTQDGYYDASEEQAVIDQINESGASIIFVAMGAPKQENWINENRHRLQASVLIGVGGLFDFYSGNISRAPVWLREVGLEWSWRLLKEPGRMWRRYLVGNFLFMQRAWLQKRRNGSVARPLLVTPAAEADVLGHYQRLGKLTSFRVRLIQLRRISWNMLRLGGHLVKRIMDIVVAFTLLILLAPLFLLFALLIRIESPGRVFYSQTRVGFRGKLFCLWKFRSMYIDADKRRAELEQLNEMQGGVIFKMKHDPRITRVGRIIRRLSIDELPQLWNILKGDMSLVGPRPALPSEVEKYTIEERVRLFSKPGLTCIWQVTGRSDIPFPQQVRLDEDYLYSQSLFTDFRLLIKTIPAVLSGKGAY